MSRRLALCMLLATVLVGCAGQPASHDFSGGFAGVSGGWTGGSSESRTP